MRSYQALIKHNISVFIKASIESSIIISCERKNVPPFCDTCGFCWPIITIIVSPLQSEMISAHIWDRIFYLLLLLLLIIIIVNA